MHILSNIFKHITKLSKIKVLRSTGAFFILSMACFAVSLCLYCCHKETNSQTETNIVPVNFKVAIPSALNTPDTANSVGTFSSLAQVKSSVNSDSINGFMVYQHLRVYIAVGDSASSVIQKMMQTISKFNITKPMQLTFQGQRDNRPKLLVETDNVYFESTWQHSIIITDIIDTAVAMKIYWNLNPVKGIAILRPYEIDKKGKNLNMPNARYRIDYSEAGENGYNAQMTISISGLAINMNNSYSINNLKIFVGRQGDIIDVYGNTNHPLAKLLLKNYTEGFNWAFAASCDRIKNIAVAEIGLPPSDSDFTSREDILVKHSIKNVLTQELKTLYPNIADTVISRLLVNTNAPGFFNSIVGFVQCGSVPNSDYSDIQSRILKLTPFDPAAINSLSITFNP